MATLIIFVYLFVIFLFLFFSKAKTINPILKNTKTEFRPCKTFESNTFFCSTNSTIFEINKKIKNLVVVFKSLKQLNNMNKLLIQSGINPNHPIVKLEFYRKSNFTKNTKILLNLKKLLQRGLKINILLFVDNFSNFKRFKKLIQILKISNNAKIYHCLEINYNLLSAINFFNCLADKQINYLPKKACFSQNLMPNGFFCIVDNKVFPFEEIGFKDNTIEYMVNTNNFQLTLKKTYNEKENYYIYCLEKTINKNIKDFIFGFNKQIPSCKQFVCNKDGCKTFYVSNNDIKNPINVIGKLDTLITAKNICFYKKINFSTNYKTFFAKTNSIKQNSKIKYANLEKLFETSVTEFNLFNLPKVFTTNKTLNALLNSYLPQKIIKNKIQETNSEDFDNLNNMTFLPNLIDKKILEAPINSYFLSSNNLFKTYFNLMYFYIGVWPSKFGLNINQNKSFILKNSILTIDKNRKIFFTMNNLKNEVKIDNVLFSNLSFLPYKNYGDLKISF